MGKTEPAFPAIETDNYDGGHGMSLRDYFAGQALAGFSALQTCWDDTDYETAAKFSYLQADAMIERRQEISPIETPVEKGSKE